MDEQLKNAMAKVSALGQRVVSYSIKQYKRKRRDVKRWMSPKSSTTWKGKALHLSDCRGAGEKDDGRDPQRSRLK